MAILRLKEIMTQKNISRRDLASKVGVSETTISNICSEKNMPTIHLLTDIAKSINVDIRELFVSTKANAVTQNEVETAKEFIRKGLKILEGKE